MTQTQHTPKTSIDAKRKAYKAEMDKLIRIRDYAPELLEALEKARDTAAMHDMEGSMHVISETDFQRIQAAIAKARGQS